MSREDRWVKAEEICANCGKAILPETRSHHLESGLPSVDLEVRPCGACGHEAAIPHLEKMHRAIALGLVNERSAAADGTTVPLPTEAPGTER